MLVLLTLAWGASGAPNCAGLACEAGVSSVSLLQVATKVAEVQSTGVGRVADVHQSGAAGVTDSNQSGVARGRSKAGRGGDRAVQPSTKPRVVFVAGLEGSGHHLLETLWTELQSAMPAVAFRHVNVSMFNILSNSPAPGETMLAALSAVRDNFDKAPAGEQAIWMLPECVSYPCGGVGDHNGRQGQLYSPNFIEYMEVAEQVGVELHVIFLFRPIEDCMTASCVHRDFEPCDELVDTVLASEKNLAAQLWQLPAEAATCFEYGDLDSMTLALEEAVGYGLQARETIERNWEDKAEEEGASEGADVEPLWSTFVQQVAPAQHELGMLCQRFAPAKAATAAQR